MQSRTKSQIWYTNVFTPILNEDEFNDEPVAKRTRKGTRLHYITKVVKHAVGCPLAIKEIVSVASSSRGTKCANVVRK